MDIHDILRGSFADARSSLVMGTSAAALAKARERSFVKRLASQLASALPGDNIRVFSDFARGNRADFGGDRLLFDIEICRIAQGETEGRNREPFHYIAGALWQAEIVFSRDWRCVIQALNRLTAGSAGQKLLVAAQSADLRASLAAPANSCPGQLYLALLPHPGDWDSDDAKSETWRMDGGEWQALD